MKWIDTNFIEIRPRGGEMLQHNITKVVIIIHCKHDELLTIKSNQKSLWLSTFQADRFIIVIIIEP